MTATLPRLKMCKRCSNVAISWDGYCSRHIHQRIRRIRNYTDRPYPAKSITNPFGVELEVVQKNTSDSREIITSVEKYACYDASISSGGGVEYKLCGADKTIADKAADTAQRAGLAGAKADKRCGFHVHMSLPKIYTLLNGDVIAASVDNAACQKLFPVLKAIEPQLMNIMPQSRRDNQYCRALYDWSDLQSHHSWVCRSNTVPTMEVRIHSGTINPWKVKAWIEVCKGLQKVINSVILDKNDDVVHTAMTDLGSLFKVNSLASKYLVARKQANGSLAKFGF